jgi:hypothetical protein
MKARATCPHCDAKMVEYRHTFNKGLAHGLYELWAAGGGPISLSRLRLTRVQWTNFQKLRYWDLVSRTRQDGEWTITTQGVQFVTQSTPITKWVWTYRGNAVRFDGDTCFFKDEHEATYDKRPDYIATAMPHGGTP